MGKLKKNVPLEKIRRGDHILFEKNGKVLYNDPEKSRIMMRESWGHIFGIIVSWMDHGWCSYTGASFKDYKTYNYDGKL